MIWTEAIPFWRNSSIHPHTHLPSPPPTSISAALLPLWSAYVLLKGWNTSNRDEAASRAWLSYEQLSFFFFFFFSCHLIDLITWSILLNNVSHLVPLFWDLSINCLLRDLRGEALFAFNERGRSSQNIHYSIGGMNYGTGLQRASYRKHLIRLSNIYHQMHVWPRSQWRPL